VNPSIGWWLRFLEALGLPVAGFGFHRDSDAVFPLEITRQRAPKTP